MKLAGIDSAGVATCILIDHDGVLRLRFHPANTLMPMSEALQPRCLWPVTSQRDLIDIELEDRRAAAKRKLARKAAKKAKRSNKIKRKAVAA